jgi:hypothetical protein
MGFVVKRPSRMQEQSFFVFGRDGHLFSGGFEKNSGGGRNFAAGLPPPGSDTPHTLVGGVISSALGMPPGKIRKQSIRQRRLLSDRG